MESTPRDVYEGSYGKPDLLEDGGQAVAERIHSTGGNPYADEYNRQLFKEMHKGMRRALFLSELQLADCERSGLDTSGRHVIENLRMNVELLDRGLGES